MKDKMKDKKKPTVFLGGTKGSKWRADIELLLAQQGIGYFNPVVEDWDEEARNREICERIACDVCLYVITPKMTAVYAIAEAIDDSNKRPQQTVLAVLLEDEGTVFSEAQQRSLDLVMRMVVTNGARIAPSLEGAVARINEVLEEQEEYLKDAHPLQGCTYS